MREEYRLHYLDENMNETTPDYFLTPYHRTGLDTDNLLKFIDKMNGTGSIVLTAAEYNGVLKGLDEDVVGLLDKFHLKSGGQVHLRGKEYHINVALKYERVKSKLDLIRNKVIDNVDYLQDILLDNKGNSMSLDLPRKAVYACLLDHQKQYSMVMLFAMYNAMLGDGSLSRNDYVAMKDFCAGSIGNYYQFVVGDLPAVIEPVDTRLVEIFRDIQLPKRNPNIRRESGPSKLIFRDLDHPGLIMLYSGNLLLHDHREQNINAIINPLYGAVEIGFGLKSIYGIYGIDKIDDIQFIRYSIYGESHSVDTSNGDIKNFVPLCLIDDFDQSLKDLTKRVVVMDDGIFEGSTMTALQSLVKNRYSREIEMAAIEIVPERAESFLNFNCLMVPAIATRSIRLTRDIIRDKIWPDSGSINL